MAPGRGLAVWQVYEEGDNTYSSIQESGNYTVPYEAFIIEATPTGSYTPWYLDTEPDPGSADTFYSGQGANPLSDTSSPDLHFWNHTTNNGRTVTSGMVIHTYTAQGPAVSYTIGSGSPSTTPAIGKTTNQITATCDYGANAPNQVFYVFNAAGGTLNYSISDNATWLSCSPASGSITTGANAITVSFSSASLPSGTYAATITISASGASNTPQTISVTLTVDTAPLLAVTPTTIGRVLLTGETSNDACFGISNSGGGSLNYTIAESAAWLSLSTISGSCTLETDLVYLTMNASGLSQGLYTTTVSITAPGAANSPQSITVSLMVGAPIYTANMNSNPGWTVQGQWAYGKPTGGGGAYGEPDPTSGYTGTNVVGYNLSGDYARINTTYWTTTPVINCTDYTGVKLRFYRWLGVESSSYDHAYLEVSNNGTTWNSVWENSEVSMNGGAWERVEYDLSAWADDQASVQIRWGMGRTDTSWHYCGWNIDDVTVLGFYCPPPTYTVAFETDGTPGATLTGTTPQTVVEGDDCTPVTANTPVSHHFVDWTKGGAFYSAANPLTVVNVTETMTLRANYAINQYTLIYTAGPNGSIAGTTPQTVNYGGSGTLVTAVANMGYHFVNWSDGGTSNPRTDTNVTSNITVTANFAINIYTLTYTAGPNGSISGTTPQTVNYGGSGTAVTAMPDAGYYFVSWSDASTENPRIDENVTENINVTASFAANTYTVTFDAQGGSAPLPGNKMVTYDQPMVNLPRHHAPAIPLLVGIPHPVAVNRCWIPRSFPRQIIILCMHNGWWTRRRRLLRHVRQTLVR